MKKIAAPLLFTLALTPACKPDAIEVDEVLKNIDQYYGRRITVKAKFRSGARCRIGEEGEWKTYCKDCQYCRGPLVVDSPLTPADAETDDWPMILGGSWEYQEIRCKGPLNQVKCHPLEPGKTYVVVGRLENQRPPKLLLAEFWEVD